MATKPQWEFHYDADKVLCGYRDGKFIGEFHYLNKGKTAVEFRYADELLTPERGTSMKEIKAKLVGSDAASNGDIQALAALVVKLGNELEWAKAELRKALK